MPSTDIKSRAMLMRREAVSGQGETLTAADAIRDAEEFDLVKPEIPRIDRKNVLKQRFGNLSAVMDAGGAVVPLALTMPVRVAVPGEIPEVAEILAGCCGLAETVNAGSSVVYAPDTPADLMAAPSATVEVYEAGKVYRLVQARGTFSLSASPGEALMLKAEIKAPFTVPASGGVDAPDIGPPEGEVLRFSRAVVVTLDGQEIDIGAFEFDLDAKVEASQSNVGPNVLIQDTAPVLKITPNAVATAAEWDQLTGAAEAAFIATFQGQAGGDRLVLDIPRAQLVGMEPEEDNGRIRRAQTWECLDTAGGAGDDSFSLTWK